MVFLSEIGAELWLFVWERAAILSIFVWKEVLNCGSFVWETGFELWYFLLKQYFYEINKLILSK